MKHLETHERDLIRRFAAGESELREAALSVYRDARARGVPLKSDVAMMFMAEHDTAVLDPLLRATYRRRLVNGNSSRRVPNVAEIEFEPDTHVRVWANSPEAARRFFNAPADWPCVEEERDASGGILYSLPSEGLEGAAMKRARLSRDLRAVLRLSNYASSQPKVKGSA